MQQKQLETPGTSIWKTSAAFLSINSTLEMKGHTCECGAGPPVLLWTGQHHNGCFSGGTRSPSQCFQCNLSICALSQNAEWVQIAIMKLFHYRDEQCWINRNNKAECIIEPSVKVLWQSAAVFTAPVAVGRTEMAPTWCWNFEWSTNAADDQQRVGPKLKSWMSHDTFGSRSRWARSPRNSALN